MKNGLHTNLPDCCAFCAEYCRNYKGYKEEKERPKIFDTPDEDLLVEPSLPVPVTMINIPKPNNEG